MNFLTSTVEEMSLTKNMERKKTGHLQLRINRKKAGSQSQDEIIHCQFIDKI